MRYTFEALNSHTYVIEDSTDDASMYLLMINHIKNSFSNVQIVIAQVTWSDSERFCEMLKEVYSCTFYAKNWEYTQSHVDYIIARINSDTQIDISNPVELIFDVGGTIAYPDSLITQSSMAGYN